MSNRELMEYLRKATTNAETVGRLAQSVETLTRGQSQLQELVRDQTVAVTELKVQMAHGSFVTTPELDAAISTGIEAAIAAHIGACPGTEVKQMLTDRDKAHREDTRDRFTILGLVLRSIATVTSVLGGIGVARALHWI